MYNVLVACLTCSRCPDEMTSNGGGGAATASQNRALSKIMPMGLVEKMRFSMTTFVTCD
jgi:hypothetical protein